jgi:hypothetical protein
MILIVLMIFMGGERRSRDQEHEQELAREIFVMRACMSPALIDYALCG